MGVACGLASALFLFLLDLATTYRESHEVIIYGLPLAGLAIGFIFERFGKSIAGGNNLVIDTIHDGGAKIPLRMTPMALLGTVATHLFGGSGGREGAALQMGASITDSLATLIKADPIRRRRLLAAGVAAGFGSVFGTPIAGAIFGLEFIVLGHIEYDALVPAIVAAMVGDFTTRAVGIHHTHYPAAPFVALTIPLLLKWCVFALAIAITAVTFIELTHFIKKEAQQRVPSMPLRMALGGIVIVAIWKLVGTSDYLGLGIPGILRAFTDVNLSGDTFAIKLIFTAITLGVGFPGGEVTPLFFIGAALGNLLARHLGIPIELGAGVGMAAVFAAASNTPLALSIMAAEVIGAGALPHVMIVCAIAYLLTGHRSIYPAQRLRSTKHGKKLHETTTIRESAEAATPD